MTKSAKTLNTIITDAKAFGFEPIKRVGAGGLAMTICEDCLARIKEAYGPNWRKDSKESPFTAVIFEDGDRRILACTCGWRRSFTIPKRGRAKTSDKKKNIKFRNKCVGKGCNNDLPEGRKSYCYTCRPASRLVRDATKQEGQSGTAY